jgi:segregation and condensation protein A
LEEFVISLEKTEYPIDTLLFLVKEKKIDIRDVNLAEMADEFMEFVQNMEFANLELMSDFIALASDLIKIKSFSLIPSRRQYARSMEERIKTSMEERERLLQKAKEIAAFAKFMESVKSVNLSDKKKSTTKPIVHKDFLRAFKNAKKRIDFREKLKYISLGMFSISNSIRSLKKKLRESKKLEFLAFIDGKEKMEKISYIVALLEIVKEDFARIEQLDNDIVITKN